MDYKKKYLKYKLKYLTVKKLYGGSNYNINPIKNISVPTGSRRRLTDDERKYHTSRPHRSPRMTGQQLKEQHSALPLVTQTSPVLPAPVIPRIIPNEEGEELLPPALPAPQEQSAFNHSDTSPFFAPQEQSALPAPQEQSALPAPTPVGHLRRLTDEERKYFGLSKAIKKQPKSKKLKVKQPEAKQVVAVLAETNKESNEASVFEPPTPNMDEWPREAETEPTQEDEADQHQQQMEVEAALKEGIPPKQGIINYPGVSQLPSGRWRARIGRSHVGTFDTAEKAAAAYRAKKEKLTHAALLENFAREAQRRI